MEDTQKLQEKLLFTIAECVELSGISKSEIYRDIERGRLRARLLGRLYRVRRVDLEAYIDALPEVIPSRPRSQPVAV